MNPHEVTGAPFETRPAAPRRLLRGRRRLRAGLVQLLSAAVGLGLGLSLPQVDGGPTVESARLAELMFTLGVGVIGLVSIVFSLLFGVVQWSASTFSPRLNMFRGDPLVWRTYAFAIGVFVFCATAGLVSGKAGRVSLVVPLTAVLAVLIALGLIRALQTRAFLSLQLANVLDAVATRGRTVIADLYPPRSPAGEPARDAAPLPPLRRTITWQKPPGVVQQLELRRLVDAATRADALVVFRVGVGEKVDETAPLADLRGGDLPDHLVRAAVIRGVERSFDQDPMLAVRLLADIGLRAMSPAVNDPATAVDAIDATESLLRALAGRQLDVADIADDSGVPRVRLVLPTWEDYLRTGIQDLLPPAASTPMVLERLHRLLSRLLEMAPSRRHAPVVRLREQVEARLAVCGPVPTHPSSEPAAGSSPEPRLSSEAERAGRL